MFFSFLTHNQTINNMQQFRRLVPMVLFSFSLILPQPPLPMEQLSLLQLSSPKSEFYEPAPSADPILSTSYELDSGYIAFVQENSFSGRDCENPYHHLREFEQVCSCKKISGMTHETLKWKLFLFFSFGRSEAMVHSCRRLCEWKLDRTSG